MALNCVYTLSAALAALHLEFKSCTSFSHTCSASGSLWIRSQKGRAASPTALVIEVRDDI